MNLKLQRGPQGGVLLIGRVSASMRRRLQVTEYDPDDQKFAPEVNARPQITTGLKRMHQVPEVPESGRTAYGARKVRRARRLGKIARITKQRQRAARMRTKHQRQSRRRRAA